MTGRPKEQIVTTPDLFSQAQPDRSAAQAQQGAEGDGLDLRRRRLLFRAVHRGTHENDILVGVWVRARIRAMTEAELDALEEVLELPDADLADWLTGRRPIPPEADSPMLRAIQAAARDSAARNLSGAASPGSAVPGRTAPGDGATGDDAPREAARRNGTPGHVADSDGAAAR